MRNTHFAKLSQNRTTTDIMINFILAAVSLFFNGFGILYSTASIAVSVIILAIDIYMKEPIGIGIVLCAVFQGPIMQAAFKSLSFDATNIEHQSIPDSIKVLTHKHA